MSKKRIILAKPMGFCAGVRRAVEILEFVIAKREPDTVVYALHQIVHNNTVVNYFEAKGVRFVNSIEDVPEGSILVLSAHGVPLSVKEKAAGKKLRVVDATCPLVTKVHREIKNFAKQGMDIIIIGDNKHREVAGTSGQVDKNQVDIVGSEEDINNLPAKSNKVSYVTQTTLSITESQRLIEKLKEKVPDIVEPKTSDICYATENRQKAVIKMSKIADCILILGSKNSSNSNQLVKIARESGVKKSYLISCKEDIDNSLIKNVEVIGITAGASTPNSTIEEVVSHLEISHNAVREMMEGDNEKITFKIAKDQISDVCNIKSND